MLVAVSAGCCGSGSYLSLEGGVGENNTLVIVVVTCDSPILMPVAVMVSCCGSCFCLSSKRGAGNFFTLIIVIVTLLQVINPN